jgi:hypothetical protein
MMRVLLRVVARLRRAARPPASSLFCLFFLRDSSDILSDSGLPWRALDVS